MDPLQSFLGIKLAHLVSGIAGGTVRALISGGDWISAVTAVITGSLTAGYLTIPIYQIGTTYLSIPQEPASEHAAGFLVGLTAMMICEGVLRFVRAWAKSPTLPGAKP